MKRLIVWMIVFYVANGFIVTAIGTTGNTVDTDNNIINNEAVLNNEAVIKMSRANLGDEIIIDEINNSVVKFLVDSASLFRLRSEKVSETVIGAMIKKSVAGTMNANDNGISSVSASAVGTVNAGTAVNAANAGIAGNAGSAAGEVGALAGTNGAGAVSDGGAAVSAGVGDTSVVAEDENEVLANGTNGTTTAVESVGDSLQDTAVGGNSTDSGAGTAGSRAGAVGESTAISGGEAGAVGESTAVSGGESAAVGDRTAVVVGAASGGAVSGGAVSEKEKEIRLIGFVIPVKELIRFYMSDLNNISGIFGEWSRNVKSLTDKGKSLDSEIKQLEGELFAKKTAANNLYDSEMLDLKSQIAGKRELFRQNKIGVSDFAKVALKAVESEGEALIKRILDAYENTAKTVKGFDIDEDLWSKNDVFKMEDRGNLLEAGDLFFPVCELIFIEKNGCKDVVLLIDKYNNEILRISDLYSSVDQEIKASEEINESLKKDAKKFKSELAVEKKKLSELLKRRKAIENEMKTACGEFSKVLKTEGSKLAAVLKERMIYIIADVDYNLQERVCY